MLRPFGLMSGSVWLRSMGLLPLLGLGVAPTRGLRAALEASEGSSTKLDRPLKADDDADADDGTGMEE